MSDLLQFRDSKKSLTFKNISPTQAELVMYGVFDESGWYDDSITSKEVLNALKDMPDTVNTVNVRINSPGGSVWAGLATYNVLKNSDKKIVVYVDGLAASIASVVALAGDEVFIGKGAMFMIHRPMSGVYGNTSEMLDMIDKLDKVEAQLVSVYLKETNLSRNEISTMIMNDTYFDEDESIKHGFATAKMEEDSYVNMAACLRNASWLKDKTSIVNNFNKHREKISEVVSDIEKFLNK